MSISKQGWLIKKLFRYLISNPLKALRMIDRRNIKIFIKAIRTENPRQIFNNFLNRINRKEEIKKSIDSKGIILRCDLSRVYDYKIQLKGWCLGESAIDEVKVIIGDELVGKLDYGIESVDVRKAFPNNKYSSNARFGGTFWGAFDSNNPITLVAKDLNGNESYLELKKFTNTENQDYNNFIKYNSLTTREKLTMTNNIAKSSFIGLAVVTFFTKKEFKYFVLLKESMQSQFYPYWDWLIFIHPNDISEFESITDREDERIKLLSQKDLNKPAAINWLASKREYNHLVHLNSNSILAPNALYELVQIVQNKSEFGIIYSDEDSIRQDLKRSKPHFKSGINHDLLLSNNYIGDFVTIYNLNKKGCQLFNDEFEHAYLYYFLLMNMKVEEIIHIPKVLIHKRKEKEKSSIMLDNKKAIAQYLVAYNIDGEVVDGREINTFVVHRKIREEKKVSIIIPFKDEVQLLKSCLESIEKNTTYSNYEILLICNNSVELDTFKYLDEIKESDNIHCYEYNIPFNYSKINNWAVAKAKGDYILFLNNDVEVISNDWLTSMVAHIQREDVGAVGAKLLYFDNSVQHAGVVIGIGGLADHVFKSFPDSHNGYFGRANLVQNLSACTAACLILKKSDFIKVKGFDEKNLAVEFNDVDLCLKLREINKKIVFNPHVKLYHYESKSRGKILTPKQRHLNEKESTFFISKWRHVIEEGDPYYNENLDLRYGDFSIKLQLT